MEYVLSQLGEQVLAARAAERPLMIRGGGTKAFYGQPWSRSPLASWLDLSAYQGVIGYEPSELVLTARAGTPLHAIETLLAEHGQMLGFEPPRFGPDGTFGGSIASGLAGPRRMAAGNVGDFVLGIRLLGADGNVMRFGGEVMKNVAGYDLSRLMVGSLGILGALVEVSVKVVSRPRCEETRVLWQNEAQSLASCEAWRAQPIPVSATAWEPVPEGEGRLTVRLSGNASAVRHGASVVGGEPLDDAQAGAFWRGLRDQTHAFFGQRPLWRITLPSGAPALDDLGPMLHEWHGQLRWLAGPRDAQALRTRIRALGGWVCLYRREGAPDDVPTFHPLAPGVLQIHRRLKQAFDPAGIFNPHRLSPDF